MIYGAVVFVLSWNSHDLLTFPRFPIGHAGDGEHRSAFQGPPVLRKVLSNILHDSLTSLTVKFHIAVVKHCGSHGIQHLEDPRTAQLSIWVDDRCGTSLLP